jgi:ubiquitin C-terminal hydrolase
MEEKRRIHYISQNNNYDNPINYNLFKIKKRTNLNKGYLNHYILNKKVNEERKNKDSLNGNNQELKKNFFHHKNILSMNDKEFYQNKDKVQGGILNGQKNEGNMPLTLNNKINGCFNYNINKNVNKIQNYNKINNIISSIYENEAQKANNGQNNYQNSNLKIIKSNTTNNQIFSFQNFKEPPLIALKCIGNTTYINTVLQCLLNIRNITSYFLRNKNIISSYKEQMPISYAFCEVASNLFPISYKLGQYIDKYDPKDFYECIFINNSIFRGKSTKNAIDFLVYLINKMHDEDLLNPNNKNQNPEEIDNKNFNNYIKYLNNHENSIILNTFSYFSQNIKNCWNCNQTNITFQKFFTYDLNLDLSLNKTAFEHKNELSIFDCIKFTSQEESIFNIYCNNCKTKNNFTKKFSIHLSLNVLIFLLRGMEKKEIVENMKNDKIKIRVDIDLDLSDLLELKYKDFSKYTFHAMILYDPKNKEYLAYSINPINKKLYKYIKEEIILVDQNDFINLFDYKLYPVILFYRHLIN